MSASVSAPDPGPDYSFIPGHQARIGDSAWDSSVGLWVDWHAGFGRDAFVARRKSTERPAMSAKMTLEEIARLSEGRTPGDWRIAAAGDYVGGGINIDAGAGGYVCLVDGSTESPSEHSRADANLIAAAPRLLEIAQEMRARLSEMESNASTAAFDKVNDQLREANSENELLRDVLQKIGIRPELVIGTKK